MEALNEVVAVDLVWVQVEDLVVGLAVVVQD